MVRGDRRLSSGTFCWARLRLNLSETRTYTPTLPWASKVRPRSSTESQEEMACDFVTFVDDSRPTGPSELEAWSAMRTLASRLQYLGIQDAPQKCRAPSRSPGPWAGTMAIVSNDDIRVTVSIEKWQKAQRIVKRLHDELDASTDNRLDRKKLEPDRGFLVHLCMAYSMLVPYMKGLHLTVDSWRPDPDDDGWKDPSSSTWIDASAPATPDQNPPTRVQAVPRLRRDLFALSTLMGSDKPTERIIRCQKMLLVLYGFGDASGSGYGSSLNVEQGILYCIGVWEGEDSQGSSNFKELRNVVEALEDAGTRGLLTDREVFFCTDNTTAEGAIYQGTSKSKVLFELVLRLRKTEASYGCRLHVTHVAGTRMITQGTDGLSRGSLKEEVMSGQDFLSFLELDKGAVEQHPVLFKWMQTHCLETLTLLQPEDWFKRGHDIAGWLYPPPGSILATPDIKLGWFVWSPPPSVADVALEELRRARHKRQKLWHFFVCPRLMTPHWRRQLHRSTDLVIELPTKNNNNAWPGNMYESLMIGFYFPYLSHRPWQLRGSGQIVELGWELQRVWKETDRDIGPILRKLLHYVQRELDVSTGVVPGVL